MTTEAKPQTEIRLGQIWREDDKRQERFVFVTRLDKEHVEIRRCDPSGAFTPRSRCSWASKTRFGRRGGYFLVQP